MDLKSRAVVGVKSKLKSMGVLLSRDRPIRDPVRLMLLKSKELGVRTILDVGANAGQYAMEVLNNGWNGRLVSFEPITVNHERLSQAARAHANWDVAHPMALGAETKDAEINVSENLVSSSLLDVGDASTNVLSETRYVRRETIKVRRLDDVVEPAWSSPYAIKTDTQGFDLEVLKGATETLKATKVLMIEMIMAPLYGGGARFGDLYQFCEDAGFRCIALTEGFADYDNNEVLQVDGVFVRDR